MTPAFTQDKHRHLSSGVLILAVLCVVHPAGAEFHRKTNVCHSHHVERWQTTLNHPNETRMFQDQEIRSMSLDNVRKFHAFTRQCIGFRVTVIKDHSWRCKDVPDCNVLHCAQLIPVLHNIEDIISFMSDRISSFKNVSSASRNAINWDNPFFLKSMPENELAM